MRRIFMGIFSLGILLLSAQSPPPATTIRVPVRLVTAPTLVFSKDGRLIPGLQRADFHVFDNGRLQEPALDTSLRPLSIAIAVQANQDVREYLPFVTGAGAVVETLLLGESGEGAVIGYGDDVNVVKPFGAGDVQLALRSISVRGKQARMIDAGLGAIALLRQRPNARTRVLIFIGQSMDSGSESILSDLEKQAERDNVTIYTATLPQFGEAFVSDTFSLSGLPQEKGGFEAGVDLGKLISGLGRNGKVEVGTDPFSLLTTATGGTQLHIRKRKQFEDAIGAIGLELRSAYLLSYSPKSAETGYHTIQIEVSVMGATVHTRPGYWLGN
jgi:VWFA-related protein